MEEPKNCPKGKGDFDVTICEDCHLKACVEVSHPGGGMGTVDKCHCELGYWADDF